MCALRGTVRILNSLRGRDSKWMSRAGLPARASRPARIVKTSFHRNGRRAKTGCWIDAGGDRDESTRGTREQPRCPPGPGGPARLGLAPPHRGVGLELTPSACDPLAILRTRETGKQVDEAPRLRRLPQLGAHARAGGVEDGGSGVQAHWIAAERLGIAFTGLDQQHLELRVLRELSFDPEVDAFFRRDAARLIHHRHRSEV